jgi:ferric-dicitrate binding protein FerR (iron transport regulator)
MNCPNAEELGLYVTHDLDADRLSAVEEHLRECGQCRKAADLLTKAGDAVRADVPEMTEADWQEFENSLLQRFRSEKAVRRARPVVFFRIAAAVAALLAVSVGVWMWLGPGGLMPVGDEIPAGLSLAHGECRLVRGGVEADAQPGGRLREGDAIETGDDGRASIVYDDGTAVDLNRNTRIELSNKAGKLVDLRRGDVFAEVARQPEGRPMVLASPTATVRVLGTVLELSADGRRAVVRMAEGRARVESEGRSAVVEAGQEVIASPAGGVEEPAGIAYEAVAPWRKAGGEAGSIFEDRFEKEGLDPFWKPRREEHIPRIRAGDGELVLTAREAEQTKIRSVPINLAQGPVEVEVEGNVRGDNTEARAWVDVILHRDNSYSVCLARVKGSRARLVVADDGRVAVSGDATFEKGLNASIRRPVGRVTVNLYLGARSPYYRGDDAVPPRRAEWRIKRVSIRRLSEWPDSSGLE